MAVTTVKADLPAEIFDVQTNVPLIHQVVVAQLAAARQGTHSTKTRGEVRGGGAKPYRQKGTGRARQGSTRAPQFTGGGVVHGPTPRDYSQRTPKKMKAAALRGALSDRARHDRVHVIEASSPARLPSAKQAWGGAVRADRAVRTCSSCSSAATRSRGRARATSQGVHVLAADQLNTYDVLCADDVVFTQGAFDAFVTAANTKGDGTDRKRTETARSEQINTSKGPSRHPHRPGRLGEVLRPARRGQVHVPRRPPVEQDGDQDRHRAGLQRQGRLGPHDEPQGQVACVPASASASARTPSAPSSRSREGFPSTSSARGRLTGRHRRGQDRSWLFASTSRPPRAVVARRSPTSSRSPGPRRRSRWSARSARAAAATTPAGSPPATSVVATSAPTASSTSVATTRTACRPRSRTSSTTPTAPRGSRCCTTPTARSATSSRRTGCKQGDTVENGPVGRHQAGQQPAAAQHPDRHRRSTRSS